MNLKKYLSCVLCGSLVLSCAGINKVQAAELPEINVMNIASDMDLVMEQEMIQAYTDEFQNMSNIEFDKTIAELARKAQDKDVLTERLAQCGVEFSFGEKEVEVSERALRPSDINISLSSARRANEGIIHLITDLTFDTQELYPGSIDSLVLFFDPDLAEYEETVCVSEAFSIQDTSTYKTGYVTLNFEDEAICGTGYRDNYTAAVYVVPQLNEKTMYGAKLGHSYTTTNIEVSGTVGVEIPKMFGGNITFTEKQQEEKVVVGNDNYYIVER